MEKFIPYEKLSKKEKRKRDLAKRTTWGELNPVTRKPQNSKAYNRRRTQDWKKDLPDLDCPSLCGQYKKRPCIGIFSFKRSGAASAAPLRFLSGCANNCKSGYICQSDHQLL